MNIGMLWFDNDPKKKLDVKIERAATYYREKYGKMPTVCFVHPSMVPETPSPAPFGSALMELLILALKAKPNQRSNNARDV
jgi:hypothetical protein